MQSCNVGVCGLDLWESCPVNVGVGKVIHEWWFIPGSLGKWTEQVIWTIMSLIIYWIFMYCLICYTNELEKIKVKMRVGECQRLLRVSLRNLWARRAEIYISILETKRNTCHSPRMLPDFNTSGCLLRLW